MQRLHSNQKKARTFSHAHIKERKWQDWLEHWHDVLLVFERVAQKCSIFLAMLTGQSQVDSFNRWKTRVRNKRVSKSEFATDRLSVHV